MDAPKTRVLCVLSTLLGNRNSAERLLRAVDKIPDVEADRVNLEPDDYHRYPAPRWAKLSNPWEVQQIAWKKSAPLRSKPHDILLVNCWESVIGFREIARRIPAIGLLDSVPSTVDSQLRARGLGGWRRRLAYAIHSSAFRDAVARFDVMLPMGSDCRAALVNDYGFSPDRCHVTLAPQDLDFWSPAPKSPSEYLRLLFVGNDFARKGGEFLLRLYSDYLAPQCRLTIASNDPALRGRNLPEGVTLLNGLAREQIAGLYRASDLFLLPSTQDFMPQVICEALATGLPCMANDVGGIGDLVQTGKTGYLMSRNDPPELWAQRIGELARSPAELNCLSREARCFAEKNLTVARFEQILADCVERLRTGIKAGAAAGSGRSSAPPTW